MNLSLKKSLLNKRGLNEMGSKLNVDKTVIELSRLTELADVDLNSAIEGFNEITRQLEDIGFEERNELPANLFYPYLQAQQLLRNKTITNTRDKCVRLNVLNLDEALKCIKTDLQDLDE